MTSKSVQAWVLHKQWSGDTSARVSFFTSEGLITSLYKGGRSPKKQALLQAFTPLWLELDERYARYFVRRVETTAPALILSGDALFSGLYLNELLYYALSPAYPDADLFQAYEMTLLILKSAEKKADIEAVLRRFEWALLKSCGCSFSWTSDAHSGLPIQADCFYGWRAEAGFVRTHEGYLGQHLLAIASDCLEDAAVLNSAKRIMRQAIDTLLEGRPLKTRQLYTKV